MLSFLSGILDKIIDRLISHRVKPNVRVREFSITSNSNNQHSLEFSVLLSNNSDKGLSVSEKKLRFYNRAKMLFARNVARYQVVERTDALDSLLVLEPVDDIVFLQSGETRSVAILDTIDDDVMKNTTKIVFSYFTGRREYKQVVKPKLISSTD